MKLKYLIKAIGGRQENPALDDFEVSHITANSKDAREGSLFVAVCGTAVDGHAFIAEALGNGAKAVVAQEGRVNLTGFPLGSAALISVPETRKALGQLAAEFYGRPSGRVRVSGITGTNGKTTVSYLMEAVLENAGHVPAVIGTVNYRFRGKTYPSGNTTPGPLEIQKMLADMAAQGVTHLAMEVSSHALDQDRTEGIDFSSAVFTNLTQDHLDYHVTLEDYFRAKAKLFSGLSPQAFAVINNDQQQAEALKKMTRAQVVTYGIEREADVRAYELSFNARSARFSAEVLGTRVKISSRLIGRHNVYNMLAALAWGWKEGIPVERIAGAFESFSFVPGRLQRLEHAQGFDVYVDYAHTDDALKNVLTALKELEPRKIILVFGCGGDRDREKRPKMGKVATELADFCIITSDNPRSEEPMDIIEDIKKGIRTDNYSVVVDRREAIAGALSAAGRGDIVLIAGKGHENYQVFKGKTVPFDDIQVAQECLRSMKS